MGCCHDYLNRKQYTQNAIAAFVQVFGSLSPILKNTFIGLHIHTIVLERTTKISLKRCAPSFLFSYPYPTLLKETATRPYRGLNNPFFPIILKLSLPVVFVFHQDPWRVHAFCNILFY